MDTVPWFVTYPEFHHVLVTRPLVSFHTISLSLMFCKVFSVQNPCLEMSAARQMIGKKNCSTIRAFWMDACNPRAHLAEAPHSSQSRIPKD